MFLQEAIETFEELKKYKYYIKTKKYGEFELEFLNHHFKHLFGIHKLDLLIPKSATNASALYKYLKKNHAKFEDQILLQIKDDIQLENRIIHFNKINLLLSATDLKLFKQHYVKHGSQFSSDYILYSDQLNIHLMLGIRQINQLSVSVFPASWMVDTRYDTPFVIRGIPAITDVLISKKIK